MAGIAGIAQPGCTTQVERMLDRLTHRGRAGRTVVEVQGTTLGVVWNAAQPASPAEILARYAVYDAWDQSRSATARVTGRGLVLERDRLGIAPLYYGRTSDGALCFASEVKALLEVTREIRELPPGSRYDGRKLELSHGLDYLPPPAQPPEAVAAELRRRLTGAVERALAQFADGAGAWLSGGLDSSAIVAVARPRVRQLHTFAAGLFGAPDLEHARLVAEHLQTVHHEVIVSPKELFAALSRVIYHLESFDALLVRSSIINFLAAQQAANYVPLVLSGEGGDELFAGYDYLAGLPPDQLAAELLDITGRLHNTALQRVDRCAAAHGLLANVPFLEPTVVEYALAIPTAYKLRDGVAKWILRRAVEDLLPEPILRRKKAKFWEGAGVGEHLAEHAEATITDADFRRERRLPNGWEIGSKEELMYYRVFCQHFGRVEDLDWMGRTKCLRPLATRPQSDSPRLP